MSKATSCESCISVYLSARTQTLQAWSSKERRNFLFLQDQRLEYSHFCKQLGDLLPRITTAIEVQHDQAKIAKEKKRARLEGTDSQIVDMTGINIAFSQQGLLQVSDTIL
jgi:hypothetical protein